MSDERGIIEHPTGIADGVYEVFVPSASTDIPDRQSVP